MGGTCVAEKSDGELCGKPVKSGEYCVYHRRQSKIKHGLKASKKTLGIPTNAENTFEEFMSREKPYELVQELAQARTLLAHYLNQRASVTVDKKKEYVDTACSFIVDALSMKTDAVKAEKIARAVRASLEDAYEEVIGPCEYMSSKELENLVKLIKNIAEIAERGKKIADGITINVNIKVEYLVRFLREVVFPMFPTASKRQEVAARLRGWLARTSGIAPQLPTNTEPEIVDEDDIDDEDVIDVE